jgi:hypothetical protein
MTPFTFAMWLMGEMSIFYIVAAVALFLGHIAWWLR